MSQIIRPIGTTADTDRIGADERLRILAHERRRIVLSALETRSVPIELSELASAVADMEENTETHDRISLTLHHRHLPMMDDHDVIEYDPEERRITAVRSELFDEI